MTQQYIIVDIDGTLSNPNHRRHHVEGDDKDWEKFFEKVDDDSVNEWCRRIIDRFWPEYNIILVTGRPEKSKSGINVKEKTLDWLHDNRIQHRSMITDGSSDFRLVMRDEGDFREDTVVKQEILDEKLPHPENILFAIDDRKDIAEMWRENGIACLQCKDEVNE